MSKTSKARAIADTSVGTILATVDILAPPERVFRALTTDEITQWWGSADTYRTTEYTGDVRPGGRWRSAGVGEGGVAFSVEGEFREVDPPKKLVQTWKAAWDGNNETVITYRLEPIPGGTRLTLRHEGFGDRVESCRGHSEGWERVLGWLSGHVSAPPAADGAKYFFCRLLPPRPTFMLDMNAAERELMMEHSGYWRARMAEGKVVVFGPVGGPSGGFGLGVVRAESEAAVEGFRDGDPVIRAGRGFRYEIAPMVTAVLPG